ncbi:MAG: alpha/beta fold hydrolase [Oscillospiraceae bacterium]|nr:alpha/beta fold hydrolase [Oscillospiraceae bacterium]
MKKTALALSLPLVLAGTFTGELYRYVFVRGGSPVLNPLLNKKGHAEDYYRHRDACAERLRRRPQERWEIRSGRGEKLCGYYIPGGGEGKRVAFLVHGYTSEHAETAGMFCDYYRGRGFDLFCCDNTAHGDSEGRFVGFDVFESEDCLLWLDELQKRLGPQVQVLLHGFSMGGATVLKMAERCPENVRAIVADSAYQDGYAQLKGQLGPMIKPLALLHRALSGCDLRKSDVRPSLDKCRLPILFVQGEEDKTVPFTNGPALYAAYAGEKDCLFVPGAKHVECMHAAPEAYAGKLDRLIGRAFG